METIDKYIEREQETLNCLICNQMFSTSHNKKEHLLGRGHLLKLMNGFEQFKNERGGGGGGDETRATYEFRTSESGTNEFGGGEFGSNEYGDGGDFGMNEFGGGGNGEYGTDVFESSEFEAGNAVAPHSISATNHHHIQRANSGGLSTATTAAANPYSPSFRDNLHTDSSNATTEDYSWNSPGRSTATPEMSSSNNNNNQSVNHSFNKTAPAISAVAAESPPPPPPPPLLSLAINHSKDALFGAMEPSEALEAPAASSVAAGDPPVDYGSGSLFDDAELNGGAETIKLGDMGVADVPVERSEFDMTKLDLPDDFNIAHDYLNELQACKLDQISPSFGYQPPPPLSQQNSNAVIHTDHQHVTYNNAGQIKYERQGKLN